ncbi:MAG: hypothetical protein AAFQ66_16400 [Pseudomonadota bacterium]
MRFLSFLMAFSIAGATVFVGMSHSPLATDIRSRLLNIGWNSDRGDDIQIVEASPSLPVVRRGVHTSGETGFETGSNLSGFGTSRPSSNSKTRYRVDGSDVQRLPQVQNGTGGYVSTSPTGSVSNATTGRTRSGPNYGSSVGSAMTSTGSKFSR